MTYQTFIMALSEVANFIYNATVAPLSEQAKAFQHFVVNNLAVIDMRVDTNGKLTQT